MKDSFQFNDRRIWYVGALAFLGLGAMAWHWCLPRVMMSDAAFQVFEVIQRQDFAIQANRFGSAVTKVFPFVAVKLGLPLPQVLLWYSLSFVVYPLALYLLLGRVLRNEYMAVVLILFYTLLAGHTFYWMQSELLQGCALVLFFYGWLIRDGLRLWEWPLLLALVPVLLFFHPLMFIPYFFLWAFFAVHGDAVRWRQRGYQAVALAAVAVLVYKHLIMPANSYDAGAIKFSEGVLANLPHVFTSPNAMHFWDRCLSDFVFFPIALVSVALFYALRREMLKLSLLLAAIFGLLVLIHGSFAWWTPDKFYRFYIESFYQLLTIFVAVPLVFDVLPQIRRPSAIFYGLVLVLALRLAYMGALSPTYTDRLEWMQQALAHTRQYEGTKFAIDQRDVPFDKLLITWGSSYETLMLSALQSPDSTRTLIIVDDNVPTAEYLKRNKAFINPFNPIPYGDFQASPYFHFQDTAHYRLLSREELDF